MLLGRSIHRTQQGAPLHPGALLTRIDSDRSHRGEIDHQPVIWDPLADHAMSAATHANLQAEIAGGQNRSPHVPDGAAANDQAWPAVDHRVPYRTCRVIARISRYEHVAIEGFRQAFSDHGVPPLVSSRFLA
jgi:hypothetical protein